MPWRKDDWRRRFDQNEINARCKDLLLAPAPTKVLSRYAVVMYASAGWPTSLDHEVNSLLRTTLAVLPYYADSMLRICDRGDVIDVIDVDAQSWRFLLGSHSEINV